MTRLSVGDGLKFMGNPPAGCHNPEEYKGYESLCREERILADQARFAHIVGPRYADATLDNYTTDTESQESALRSILAYADDMKHEVMDLGTNIVLFGSTGTGKDHLLIGLARRAIGHLCPVL